MFTISLTKPGDQLAIAKETGRRLGMGTNMYPSSALLGHEREEHEAIPVDELIEKADGFAGVFPGKSVSKVLRKVFDKFYVLSSHEKCISSTPLPSVL